MRIAGLDSDMLPFSSPVISFVVDIGFFEREGIFERETCRKLLFFKTEYTFGVSAIFVSWSKSNSIVL